MNSRAKGCRGERMWRDVLRSFGYASARRGQQFSGGNESPDVVCAELPYHWEVKCVQSLNVIKAFEQARTDSAGSGKVPVVAHKKNGKPWLITMSADDFLALVDDAMTPTE